MWVRVSVMLSVMGQMKYRQWEGVVGVFQSSDILRPVTEMNPLFADEAVAAPGLCRQSYVADPSQA